MDISSRTKLNNGIEMPFLGLGVYQIRHGKKTYEAVSHALEIGYRHIDTAQFYNNEESVGKAVRESSVAREDVFVVSKLQISNFGYEETLSSFDKSLEKFEFEYLDLFLLHWPVEGLRLESWKALEQIYKSGKVKAIGVSNFTIAHLEELLAKTVVTPAVNQVEFSPYLYQKELHEYCKKKNIQLEAYSPLVQANKMNDPKLLDIAEKYGKSAAQILIKWGLQHEIVTIPKSSNPERMSENADVFAFEISKEDMDKLDNFNENLRMSWNPEDEKQVKSMSKFAVKKLSGIASKAIN